MSHFLPPCRWWWCYYCCWLTFFISHSKDWLSGILPFWQFRQSHLLYRIPINLALADRTVLRIVTLSTRGFVDMSRHPTDTKKGDVRYGISRLLNLKLSVLLLTASLALTRGHRIDFENCWVNDFVKKYHFTIWDNFFLENIAVMIFFWILCRWRNLNSSFKVYSHRCYWLSNCLNDIC